MSAYTDAVAARDAAQEEVDEATAAWTKAAGDLTTARAALAQAQDELNSTPFDVSGNSPLNP